MGDHLGTLGAVDFLANPQLPSVASMANPLGGPGRGSSLGSETHPAFYKQLACISGVVDMIWGKAGGNTKGQGAAMDIGIAGCNWKCRYAAENEAGDIRIQVNCFLDFAVEHWFWLSSQNHAWLRRGYWRHRSLIDWLINILYKYFAHKYFLFTHDSGHLQFPYSFSSLLYSQAACPLNALCIYWLHDIGHKQLRVWEKNLSFWPLYLNTNTQIIIKHRVARKWQLNFRT